MPTHKEFLLLLIASVSVFVASGWIELPQNSWAFTINAAFSWAIIVIFLSISSSKLAIMLATVNILLVLHNIFACIGYLNYGNFFLSHYNSILVALNAIELGILLLGVPLSGIYTGVSKRRNNAGSSFSRANFSIQSFEVKKCP